MRIQGKSFRHVVFEANIEAQARNRTGCFEGLPDTDGSRHDRMVPLNLYSAESADRPGGRECLGAAAEPVADLRKRQLLQAGLMDTR
jgi:hypothetical protein